MMDVKHEVVLQALENLIAQVRENRVELLDFNICVHQVRSREEGESPHTEPSGELTWTLRTYRRDNG